MRKINSEGQYLTFPGVTVVASIDKIDQSLWRLVYETLIKIEGLNDYFSPMPYECYHMTTNNLFTKDEIGPEKWHSFLTSNSSYFQSLHRHLAENSFIPNISIQSVITDGAIQILVTLPQEQQDIIEEIASIHQSESGIPSFFHITLAYQYKDIQAELLEQFNLVLNQELLSIFKAHKQTLSLAPPKLCFFNDMTKFTPWTGEEYPFPDKIVNSSTLFTQGKDSLAASKPQTSECMIM